MEWGLLIIGIIAAVIGYAVIQETRAQRHWRGLTEAGNVDAIRQVLQNEMERWRTERVPKGVPAALWHGVQTIELLDVGPDFARVSCSAEGQYAMAGGRRVEVSGPFQEGMKLTRKLADMVLYDIPNLRLARVQVDVYTTFREESGAAGQACILSTIIDRSRSEDIDWEAASDAEFVAHFEARYLLDARGAAHPIDPDEGALRAEGDGTKPRGGALPGGTPPRRAGRG